MLLSEFNEKSMTITKQIEAVERYMKKFNQSRHKEMIETIDSLTSMVNSATDIIKGQHQLTLKLKKDHEENLLDDEKTEEFVNKMNEFGMYQNHIVNRMSESKQNMERIIEAETSLSPEEIHNNSIYIYVYTLYESLIRLNEQTESTAISDIIRRLKREKIVTRVWYEESKILREIRNKCVHGELGKLAVLDAYAEYVGTIEEGHRYVIKNRTIPFLIDHVYKYINLYKKSLERRNT
ncbi:hypothetical protein J2T19_001509 [Paenibacillus tundrae]|uniref:MAE-28990/MAE-18760-like HEPN domain-containing protein n=2 Tax=Paenibacillus tundrae TaxID=528187 RepID=A0ABT9WA36_9BACL|nr:hypothetical protein [Paenibacillus tundrae]